MKKYYYCVNTGKDGEPVQLKGYIEANSKEDAIQKLVDNGTVDHGWYEFLDLIEEDVLNFLNEVRDLQRKYGIYIGTEYDEVLDYDWDERPYVSGIDTYVTLEDKNGHCLFKVYDGLFYD